MLYKSTVSSPLSPQATSSLIYSSRCNHLPFSLTIKMKSAFVSSAPLAASQSLFTSPSISEKNVAFVTRPAFSQAARLQKTTTMMASGLDKSQIPLNLFRPNAPYEATCISNELITGPTAPGEVNHIVIDHAGNVPYLEGQSIGVIPPGMTAAGKPEKVRLYSIASTAKGDFMDSKTVSLCVKRLVYEKDGVEVKGVCSNFLCDLKPGDKVNISGPVGTAMLMPADTNATIIMLATGTGIAPFRSFLRRAFSENNPDYKFTGKMWLFLGVPTTPALMYQEEFAQMKKDYPDNFQVDYCISREQTDKNGQKMYIQNRMAEYADELYNLFKKPNTYVYMCGLKGMEGGIDDIMTSLFAKDGMDWNDYRKQMKKDKRWEVETY